MRFLEADGWKETLHHLEQVRLDPIPRTERQAAQFLADNLNGIGPKQSRNLLQGLGISQWETPIDSRITKWLNANGFPLKLSAGNLADREYYNFVMDGFQELCRACGLSPCILDAAIFASTDGDGWTDENVVW
jgi:thermostable 8-oxoguanine DNA glycosylase